MTVTLVTTINIISEYYESGSVYWPTAHWRDDSVIIHTPGLNLNEGAAATKSTVAARRRGGRGAGTRGAAAASRYSPSCSQIPG